MAALNEYPSRQRRRSLLRLRYRRAEIWRADIRTFIMNLWFIILLAFGFFKHHPEYSDHRRTSGARG